MSLFTTLKDHLTKIKQAIDEMCKKRDDEMEKWKEEDPDAYYDFINSQFNQNR